MEGVKVPGIKERQFYKDDYGSMMNNYEKHLQHSKKIKEKKDTTAEWQKKKAQLRKWTEADQMLEDALWAS